MIDERPHAAGDVAAAREHGVGAKAGEALVRQELDQRSGREVVGDQVIGQHARTDAGAHRLVQQTEIVADDACGHVHGMLPARPQEYPPAPEPEGLGDEAPPRGEVGDARG